MKKNQKELYSLSGQLVEIFIKDVLTKNKVATSELKERLSEEQRESLKETVLNLQEQVEDFLYNREKTKIDSDNEANNQETANTIKDIFNKKQTNKDAEENETVD